MSIDTYAELQSEVAAWMQRSDLASNVPVFIEFATAYFNQHLRHPQMEQRAQSTINEEFTDLPDDFVQLRYIENSRGKRLEYKTPEEYQELVAKMARPDPPVYTIADMSFRIFPTPNEAFTILYYQQIPDLVNASDTNWLLSAYPNAYLSCALMYGFDFLHDDVRAAKWEARTNNQIALIQRAGKRLSQGAATMTIKTVGAHA